MPIYEFECSLTGLRFDRIVRLSNPFSKLSIVRCQIYHHWVNNVDLGSLDNHDAERVWSLPSNIQLGKPTIVFVNPQTGAAQVATSQYDAPPPGFIKEELKGPIERSKFEHQQSELAKMDDLIFNEDIRQKREEFKGNHLKLIDEHLREDSQSSDNPELTVKLMNAAKERIRKKSANPKKRKTEFRLDVNHIDNSNLK